MKRMFALAAAVAALTIRPAFAEPAASATPAGSATPVVVELFTSQGCYSCPPAEAYLGELAKRDEVVALEWHVDYWDDLVYGSAGQWKDPFSSPEATRRQYAYNAAIEGRPRAYTPQMIVGGRKAMVGTQRDRIEDAIRRMRKAGAGAALAVSRTADGAIEAAAGGGVDLWRVDFLKLRVTEVQRGENKGKRLESHNIVLRKTKLGLGGQGAIRSAAPAAGEGCAILAQVGETGPVLAGAYCLETDAR